VRDALDPATDAKRRRRRRRWIVAWSLPGFLACGVFALMGALESSGASQSDALFPLMFPIVLAGVASWGVGPFCTLVALWLLFRDPWRRDRARRERISLRLLVWGSPIAWVGSNLIADAYHLLR
jgi:hypothetical protein